MHQRYDIIVVGGGHAGIEAAAAGTRLGRRVALLTHDPSTVGALSCNPAIGGLGKGHLVREIDALGGLMGSVADRCAVQFRRLNTRKGLAVQASRAQVDIHLYPAEMQRRLTALEGLDILTGDAAEVLTHSGRVAGVRLADGQELHAPALILCTGTFLRGLLHRGEQSTVGGRAGDASAEHLSASLQALGLRLGRLKTGTVPRLLSSSIDWERTALQEDTWPQGRFSVGPVQPRPPQLDCFTTRTNERTHAIIRAALDRSPLYTGRIEGTGPRYCPSIEDKIVRFPHRERHLVFLEPEGHTSNRVYPNGLPTSLPEDTQVEMVRSIVGLERVEIVQWGYAVEYDFADPRDLGHDLQHQAIPGLYLAGQVNGTSGYEEAAAQGLIAGISAALGEPFHVERHEGYLGVLVDDLVTRGVGGEPYRMFTSRAEHRLLLREDNADARLMPRARALGLVEDETWAAFERRQEDAELGRAALRQQITPTQQVRDQLVALGLGDLHKPVPAEELLRRPEVDWAALSQVADLPDIDPRAAEAVEIDVKYAGYVARAQREVEEARRMEAVRLPVDTDWSTVPSLSSEVRERLSQHRPATLGAMARLPGITPAAVNAVAVWLAGRR